MGGFHKIGYRSLGFSWARPGPSRIRLGWAEACQAMAHPFNQSGRVKSGWARLFHIFILCRVFFLEQIHIKLIQNIFGPKFLPLNPSLAYLLIGPNLITFSQGGHVGSVLAQPKLHPKPN